MTTEPHATGQNRLTITVLVCTYHRPAELLRCLKGIELQQRRPDEVMVTVRPDDTASLAALETVAHLLPLRIVLVHTPGLVAARNACLGALTNDVVVMIDDDAVPYPSWIQRIEAHFLSDPKLGGVGGRDRCVNNPDCDTARGGSVGIVRYWGGRVGNNHIGFGPPRETHTLKGVNMSYRRTAIGDSLFDTRLRGTASQSSEDLAFSLRIRSKGWKLLYDPEVLVDHYEGFREEARHYAGMVPITDPRAFGSVTYNWIVAIWDNFSPFQRLLYFCWQFFIGTRNSPGLLQALRFTPRFGALSWKRFLYTQQALFDAFRELPNLPRPGSHNQPSGPGTPATLTASAGPGAQPSH